MESSWQDMQTKWQKAWQKAELGKAKRDESKEKFMMIFAYPGISGFLHVGHMRGFSYTDAICRLERMKGKEVFFPVGTHASGNHAFAFAKKVKNKDEKWITYLKNNGCTDSQLKDMETPEKIIDYFNGVYVEEYWKKFGFISDWGAFTCTTYKDYEKFIQWQFKKLKEKNLLVQKPYYAPFSNESGPVAVDPSETDISKGGNAEKVEYTLLKFKLHANSDNPDYLVAATLRPETIYGQTNLWINPEAEYCRVQVENEHWIMSKEAAEKITYQIDNVIIKEDIDPKTLLGQTALAPGIEREVPILPASFVSATVGSGIVTCVPSDAPYDYIALQTLKEENSQGRKNLAMLKINLNIVDEIKLIPIIESKGYKEFPAKEISEKLNIKSLEDKEKLDEATKEIYKVGFHSGIMRENCGKYAGMKVAQAKEAMKLDLLQEGKATIFHDLSEEVICRNGGKVFIKRIDDQWFIKYSDSDVTEKSKGHVPHMSIYPKEYAEQMPSVLDWFQDRSCARLGNWMGSKFPYDDKWTVEPISDSTLYPAYYVISRYTNSKQLTTKDLSEAFFDYVFLGKEPTEEQKQAQNITEDKFQIWQEAKKDFDYFYPLDINLGGKEHKTVHFPVFLMNHVGILPADKWPKGILVNWWVTGKGGKISKSKGGAEPIPGAIEKYGVDAMRLYYAHIGSPHVDVVWTEETVLHYKNALEKIISIFEDIKKVETNTESQLDDWLTSSFNQSLLKINEALTRYNLRELASESYFAIPELFKWYLRRGGANKTTLNELAGQWLKLICPITPHLAEELAEQHSLREEGQDFVSTSSWPQADEAKVSASAQAQEEMIKNTMQGMRNVIKLAKLEKPSKFTLFTAQEWLYPFVETVKSELKITRNLGEIIRKVMQHEDFKVKGKEVSKMIGGFIKDPSKLPHVVTSQEAELATMQSAKAFLEKEFGCTVEVLAADQSDHPKAKSAMPGKVGILIE